MKAMKRCHTIGPFFGDRKTIDPRNRVAGSARIVSPHLEACCEHNAIDIKRLTISNQSSLSKSLNTLAIGID
ncbi:MAG: Uncharacterised protein [Halieaceae bacterium]|nr:MAG: Uncharacterised protein [Halieaceae bacterium]